MRKILIILAAAAALVFGLSSCDMALKGEYTFNFDYDCTLSDKAAFDAVSAYLNDFITIDGLSGTFEGSYGEAVDWALGLYYKGCSLMNYELVAAFVTEPTDVVQVSGWLSGPKTNEAIARLTWDYDSLHPNPYGF